MTCFSLRECARSHGDQHHERSASKTSCRKEKNHFLNLLIPYQDLLTNNKHARERRGEVGGRKRKGVQREREREREKEREREREREKERERERASGSAGRRSG
jgi:hypothetical protein